MQFFGRSISGECELPLNIKYCKTNDRQLGSIFMAIGNLCSNCEPLLMGKSHEHDLD